MPLATRSFLTAGATTLLGLLCVAACGDQSLGAVHWDPAADAGDDAFVPSLGPAPDAAMASNDPCGPSADGSNQGCEFYSVVPPVWAPGSGSCFAAVLINPGTASMTITVDIDATSLDVGQMARIPKGSGDHVTYDPLPGGKLPGGQTAILFLSRFDTDDYVDDNDCPAGIVPGLARDPAILDTGRGSAFHIKTDVPAAAFDIFPYGGRIGALESATLLIPTNVWGKSYVAVDPYQADSYLISQGDSCDPFLQLVATEDATHITLHTTGAIVGGPGVPAAPAGAIQTYSLNEGEVIQFKRPQIESNPDGLSERLVGSAVRSDKPIGMWGGAPGVYMVNASSGHPTHQCDSAHQQIPPTTALGFEYVAVQYRDRVATIHETVPWTLIGVADDTTLTYDPAPPPGAPMTVKSGEVFVFNASSPFTVKSTDNAHPFYFAGHMTGYWTISNTDRPADGGEPELVNTIPPEQWLTAYQFITDLTFRNTNLVFTRKKGKSGAFEEVTLDCAGVLTGWTPVGTAGEYELARIDLAIKGAPVGACANGPHKATSDAPFGVTVWGWDNFVTYAYPAGGGVRAINSAPPLK